MRTSTAALLSLPFVTVANGTVHGHNHGHAAHRRALEVQVVTVTTVIYHTVTATNEPVALPTSASQERSSASSDWLRTNNSQVPQKEIPPIAPPDAPSPFNGNPYKQLVPVPGSASVVNSCDYPVYLWSDGDSSCGPGVQCELIAPNTTYTEKMRKCHKAGISLKVSKSQSQSPIDPMQFEYTVWDNADTVSYDISYLNCMRNEHGEKDLSACAGHEKGIQAVGGVADDAACPDYHCMPDEWCDQQAYVVAEFDYKPGAPVGACAVDKGVAFELCAGNR